MTSAIKSLIKKAVITLTRTNYRGQCEYFETTTKYEAIKPYGFNSIAKPGSLVLLFNNGSDESNKIGLEFDNKKLYNIESGEVVIYHPDKQSYVMFKNDGSIEIEAKSDLNITGTTVHNGNLTISGDLDVSGGASIGGSTSIGGSLTVTGTVTAAGVTASGALSGASASIGGKDFTSHKHQPGTYVAGGDPVTGQSGNLV